MEKKIPWTEPEARKNNEQRCYFQKTINAHLSPFLHTGLGVFIFDHRFQNCQEPVTAPLSEFHHWKMGGMGGQGQEIQLTYIISSLILYLQEKSHLNMTDTTVHHLEILDLGLAAVME